ncbi:MAG: threonine synthase [Oscillospiraceae bacterium]|jgi:threonine synthase|nr:threonine synthase [Oscillospiraceae bacterium]
MYYNSTRNSSLKLSSAEAIVKGISDDGGLFLPNEIPSVTLAELKTLGDLPYSKRAEHIFKKFLTDFSAEEIEMCTSKAYAPENWDTDTVTKTVTVGNAEILELWHGKTCAFKDMALQVLPYLLVTSAKKTNITKDIVILVATSGDTGKAALEGFKDVKGTKIIVFYPEDGVSPMQKKQMVTQAGENVLVCAVKGNFDDCQNGVKEIFGSSDFDYLLADYNAQLSSANSINWGRLLPQIVYYISAYAELLKENKIAENEKINIVVPTGNFGNILAAYYAKEMGLPVNKLICASNKNKILTDFLNTGVYDRNREFFTTISPSMDSLISSNLERLLYLLSDENCIKYWFEQLKTMGKYQVPEDVSAKLKESFFGGYCDDTQTVKTIEKIFGEYHYLCDTHTAVAVNVYEEYVAQTGDKTKTIIASTANPCKFSNAVLGAVGGDTSLNEYAQLDELKKICGIEIPPQLNELKSKEPIYTDTITKEEMKEYVLKYIKGNNI